MGIVTAQSMSLSEFCRALFITRTDNGLVQFFRYGFVGGVSALSDIGTLVVLTSGLHVHYLISATVAFVIGTIVNYFLSTRWVFRSSGRKSLEFFLFTLIGFGGLCLNNLILWALVSKGGVFYLFAKFVSVSVVLFWSFLLRKLLFSKLNGKSLT